MSMKKHFQYISFLVVLATTMLTTAFTTKAQVSTNDWIDYDKTYYKFYVEEDGLMRIPYSVLQAAGLPMIGSHFKLINNGEEVPIFVSTDGQFLSDDYIEFIGRKNDGKFDTQLFKNVDWQVTDRHSLFTDKNAYFLVSDDAANHVHYNQITNNITNPPAKLEYFEHTVETIYPQSYSPGLAPRLVGGVNNHFADFNPSEGYASLDVEGGNLNGFDIETFDVYNNGESASLEVKVLGKNDDVFSIPDHHIILSINNFGLVDTSYEGYEKIRKFRSIPLSILQDENELILESIGDEFSELSPQQNPSVDKNALAYAFIKYNRGFDLNNERVFDFKLDNEANYVEFENFNGGSEPLIYDITNRMRLELVFDGTTYKVNLPSPNYAGEKRELFMVNSTSSFSVNTIENLEPVTFTDFSATAGNYLLIYNELLTEITNGQNQIQRYKEYRESVAGGSYKVVLAEINELYDQFAYGVVHHPMSINNFVNYTIQQYEAGVWNTEPEFLFLVGKGIRYNQARYNEAAFEQNLVPTFGSGGDIMLATENVTETYIPQVGVGRLSARNADEVRAYLEKVIEHEDIPNTIGCDVEELRSLRDVIHMAGGNSGNEAGGFKDDLDEYKLLLEDREIGAKVVAEFIKETQDVIANNEQVHPYINDGLMLINYVGHANATTWEFDIKTAEEYTNYGRYPFVISNSCFVGDVFQPIQNNGPEVMSINWTNADGLGAIGFIATVRFGFPSYLHTFTKRMHELFCKEQYRKEVGSITQQVINDIYMQDDVSSEGVGRKITCQEFTLMSDPAIKIGYFDKPILYFDENDISINPQVIDTAVDSFEVKIALSNFGAATYDSSTLVIERTFPNGTNEIIVNEKFIVPIYQDTISYWVQSNPLEGLGANSLKVYLDNEAGFNAIDCFQEVQAETDVFIVPNAATPVSPCNYAIVGGIPTLNASTSLATWDENNTYIIQIDSLGTYESPLAEASSTGIGGVISWQPPSEIFVDGTEYFWRISQQPEPGDEFKWRTSSFIYMAGEEGGWNQSDYYQFAENRFDGLRLQEINKEFDYVATDNFIAVTASWTPNSSVSYLNNETIAQNSCLFSCGNGVMVAAFKPSQIIEPIKSVKANDESGCAGEGQWGNIFCSGSTFDQYIFGFYTGDADKIQGFNNFLNSIPNGYYILAYSVRNHRFEATSNMATEMAPIVDFFVNDLGATGLANIEKDIPFIVFGKKGDADYYNKEEVYGIVYNDEISIDITVEGKDNNGAMTSALVGPSAKWDKLVWDGFSVDNIDDRDEIDVDIMLRGADGETTLFQTASAGDEEFSVDLSSIDADLYPFIELVFDTKDTLNYTAPQLNYWRVYHDKYVELALNPASQLSFDSDTIMEGQFGVLDIAVENVMPFASDSVAVQFTVTDLSSNLIVSNETVMYPPIEGGSTFNLNYLTPTAGLSENSSLFIQMNAGDGAQNEKFSFNNQLLIPFFVVSDELNPIVDVTFDGDHILDGDIVSTNPVIDIELKDENLFLAMNDTSLMQISLVAPNGDTRLIGYNDLDVNYTLATASDVQEKNNVFSVELNPEFIQDGVYQLKIDGQDASDNKTGTIDYTISFQVVSEATISHVVNYPNPFTTSTQFVFNLTGTEVPDDLHIQIMTVTGKVVKEITRAELGNLRIGRNITDYAWDGKDKYGNELANGVYFYRVSASNNGEELGLFSQSEANGNVSSTNKLDEMFGESQLGSKYKDFGIGKMYKLR